MRDSGDSRPTKWFLWVVLLFLWLFAAHARGAQTEDASAVEKRLAETAGYLTSKELGERALGTKGVEQAADYIVTRFRQYGLKTDCCDGTPFQTFKTFSKMSPKQKLVLVGPSGRERIKLKLHEDFIPLAIGGSGQFDVPLGFAGYGITDPERAYDDYAGLDVAGKAVIVLRQEPRGAASNSAPVAGDSTEHGTFARKLANARDHGVAAVVLVDDDLTIQQNLDEARGRWQNALDRLAWEHAAFKKVTNPSLDQIQAQRRQIDRLMEEVDFYGKEIPTVFDQMLSYESARREPVSDVPVVFCRRSIVDRVVRAATGDNLTTLQRQIAEGPTPQSCILDGWRATGRIRVDRLEAKNVVAVLEGEGPLAEETIVVGAHYDSWAPRVWTHDLYYRFCVGNKPRGALWLFPGLSFSPGGFYPGADDNAAGVAVMLEVARELARLEQAPRRRLVFIAFSAHEGGGNPRRRALQGSRYYVDHPLFPLEKTVAMINFEMVGRLRDDLLSLDRSSPRFAQVADFDELLDRINSRHGFCIHKSSGGAHDALPFCLEEIPTIGFHEYQSLTLTALETVVPGHALEHHHRPTDRFKYLNIAGMRRIAAMAGEVVAALAVNRERPE